MPKMKILVVLILCCFFLVPTILPPNQSSHGREAGFASFPSLLPLPVQGSEEETIDSFNVHPLNRWSITNVGYTASVTQGLLKLTDVGDNSIDKYEMSRELTALDDKIIIKFMFNTSANTTTTYDGLFISLSSDGGSSDNAGLYTSTTLNNVPTTTYLGFNDHNGFQSQAVSSSENLVEDTWYLLTIDFDLLKSSLSFKTEFALNGSDVFDYDYYDISNSFPSIFAEKTATLYIRTRCKTSGVTWNLYIDYVDAPFKEHEWSQTDTPADSDYLYDSWHQGVAQDDIDETSAWQLVVPYLDGFSGEASISSPDDVDSLVQGEDASIHVRLYNVDSVNGTTFCVAYLRVWYGYIAGVRGSSIEVLDPDGSAAAYDYTRSGLSTTDWPKATFSFGLSDDRSQIDLKVRAYLDGDSSSYEDLAKTYDVTTYTDNPSQEYVIEITHEFDFDSDVEKITTSLNDVAFKSRFIFEAVASIITNIVGFFLNIIVTIFTIIGLFLAGVFKIATDVLGTVILGAFAVLTDFLSDPLGFLSNIFASLGDLADWIWAAIVAGIEELIDAIILLANLFVDLGAGILFFFWDALNLPNVLVWLEGGIAGATNILAGFGDVITFIITISTILGPLTLAIQWGLPIAMGPNIEGYMDAWTRIAGFDLTFGLLEGYIPKFPFIILAVLLWIPFLGIYAGFF